MTRKRRPRVKQVLSFHERIIRMAELARQSALRLPPGREQERLLNKARQAENVLHLDEALSLPGRGSARDH
jgi:hypothetical protein